MYVAAIGHLCHVMQTYNKIQIKFNRQQEKLIARQLISKDLFITALSVTACKINLNTCDDKLNKANIMPSSDVLILRTLQHDIIYSLRKSVIPNAKQRGKYALYRDDTIHPSQAIVENVKDLRVKILTSPFNQQIVTVTIEFFDNYILEITCTLPH